MTHTRYNCNECIIIPHVNWDIALTVNGYINSYFDYIIGKHYNILSRYLFISSGCKVEFTVL